MNRRYCNGMVHVIKPGDTLYQLSRYYRIPMAMLLRANPYVDVYNLQVGQEICIPMVRAHRGMICMPVPKDEPLPVTAVADETETETQLQSQEESSAQKMSRKNWQKNRQKHRKKKKSFLLKTLRARKKRKKCTSPMASKAWAKY